MKHREKISWITAQQVRKLTGFTHEDMRALRKNNVFGEHGFFKLTERNSYLYNASMIQPLIKKEVA